VTPRLLDLLEKQGAHATFFLIGKFVRECPELVREIAARGHAIGNHTDTHPDLIWLSSAQIREELRRCEESMGNAIGAGSRSAVKRWMRPPYGARGPQLDAVRRGEGIVGVVMWSVLCWDWKPQPASRLIGRLARVGDGDIVVMHDGDFRAQNGDRGHVVEALTHWLPRWRDAGFEFVTMNEAAAD
jgi:peptidoglycan/xylan/chitin deacetylase (PgdA/CDA1 family)